MNGNGWLLLQWANWCSSGCLDAASSVSPPSGRFVVAGARGQLQVIRVLTHSDYFAVYDQHVLLQMDPRSCCCQHISQRYVLPGLTSYHIAIITRMFLNYSFCSESSACYLSLPDFVTQKHG